MKPLARIFMLAAISASVLLLGCTTPPTATQAVSVTAVVGGAVSFEVTKNSSDPAVWSARATKIVSIATQLKAVGSTDMVSARAIITTLQPLFAAAHLKPNEIAAANSLVVALAPLLDQNIKPGDPRVVNTLQVIQYVIDAASVYVIPPA